MSRHYIVTCPAKYFVFAPTALPDGLDYFKGQLELGEGGLLHWQMVVCTTKKCRLTAVKKILNCKQMHVEVVRSEEAENYVWKDDTSVEGTRFWKHGAVLYSFTVGE